MQITHRLSGATLYVASDVTTLRAALEQAVASGANLRGANLRGANLRGADLRGADLTGADLRGANLRGANLDDAHLRGADLRGAYLEDANLTGANLTGANLEDAYLEDAHLAPIRDDLFEVLAAAPHEVGGLRQALAEGRINGTAYEGECACLVGTIANLQHCHYRAIPGVRPDSSRPIERLFLAIRPGDTPENHPVATIVAEWIDAWRAEHQVHTVA